MTLPFAKILGVVLLLAALVWTINRPAKPGKYCYYDSFDYHYICWVNP